MKETEQINEGDLVKVRSKNTKGKRWIKEFVYLGKTQDNKFIVGAVESVDIISTWDYVEKILVTPKKNKLSKNKVMTENKQKMMVKYHNTLQDLFKLLKQPSNISVTKFMKSRKINTDFMKVVIERNIISCDSSGIGGKKYTWTSSQYPSTSMAFDIIKDLNKLYSERMSKKYTSINLETLKSKNKAVIDYSEKTLEEKNINTEQNKIKQQPKNETEKDVPKINNTKQESCLKTVRLSILWGLITYESNN